MKAKPYLQKIRKTDAKINAYIEELAQLEALATKTTSVLGGERVQSSGSQQKMADAVDKIIELKEKINNEIDKLCDMKDEVRSLLFENCDIECMSLLHKRYFIGKEWEEIADDMNYSEKWVSGGLHQKALNQVQKALNERGSNGTEGFNKK